ncbi:sulfotransferase 2A1-like, partial [Marmota marmota marmota]|uniref:sulfotransferase 2A1-like n=1 Tax=Marmota marmota marmota TaxID=9994 RepID=UPI0020926508
PLYPGTLWLIEILCLIHSRGDPKWVQSVPCWKRSPWIERRDAEQLDGDSEGLRCFTSHLPFHLFPKSFFTSKGKVIYIIRNPRDALVSGYFFWCRTNFAKNPDSLEQFFEQFIQGNGECPPCTKAGVHRVPIQTSLGPNPRPCISPPVDAPPITRETRPVQVPALLPTSTAQPSRCPWGTSWLSSSLSSRH